MKLVGLIFLCAAANAIDSEVHNIVDSNESNDTRKYYGLSFNHRCKSYQRVFKCMSACKAMSFQVYRIDQRCKCTCHEMKTSTILPFFKWRTNGTTPPVPKTRSVRLYEIAGTIFPLPETTEEKNETTNFTCPTFDYNFTSTPPLNATENAKSTETTTTAESTNSTGTESTNSTDTESTNSTDTESTNSTDTESTTSTVNESANNETSVDGAVEVNQTGT